MTQTEKSFVQVASNSLTLDDISKLIAKAKVELPIEESSLAEPAASESASVEPDMVEPNMVEPNMAEPDIVEPVTEPSSEQQLTEAEVYNQTLSEASQTRPAIEELNATLSTQSFVRSVSVPLVNSTSEGAADSTATTTTTSKVAAAGSTPLSFEAALTQLESRTKNRPETRSNSPDAFDTETSILPRHRAETVQSIPFVKPKHVDEIVALRNDIQEQGSDWLSDMSEEQARTRSIPDQRKSGSSAEHVKVDDSQLSEFARNILAEFPFGTSCVLLIGDADGNTGSNEVANQLARELAGKKVGRILLIDSHLEKRVLTQELAPDSKLGVADVISMDRSLEETLCETDIPNLDFLPAGTPIMCRRRDQQRKKMTELTRSIKSDYQFVVVSIGSAFEHAAKVWGKHSEATYITVSMSQSNRKVAQIGVRQLQKHGARLMGCVVTDAASAAA